VADVFTAPQVWCSSAPTVQWLL